MMTISRSCRYSLVALLVVVVTTTLVCSYTQGDVAAIECCFPQQQQGKVIKTQGGVVNNYEFYVDYLNMKSLHWEKAHTSYYDMTKQILYRFDRNGCRTFPVYHLDDRCETHMSEHLGRTQVRGFDGTGWEHVDWWRVNGTGHPAGFKKNFTVHFTVDKVITDGGDCYKANKFVTFENGSTVTHDMFNDVRNTILDPNIFDIDISECI